MVKLSLECLKVMNRDFRVSHRLTSRSFRSVVFAWTISLALLQLSSRLPCIASIPSFDQYVWHDTVCVFSFVSKTYDKKTSSPAGYTDCLP